MSHFVYMLIGKKGTKLVTYVGYTKNLLLRLNSHNTNKGAKFTKGNKWKIIYSKKFYKESIALNFEFKLKKNIKKRNTIKNLYLDIKNINSTNYI